MSNNNSTTQHIVNDTSSTSKTETELEKRYHYVYDKLFDAHLQILVTNNAVIKSKYNYNSNSNSNYTTNDKANSNDTINDTPDDNAYTCAVIASREAYKQLTIAYNNTLNIKINGDTETNTDFSKSCDTSELLIKTRIAITNYYSSSHNT